MLSTKNLLKPADGSPVVAPSKDMVLGNYYLTMDPTAEIVCADEPRRGIPALGRRQGTRPEDRGGLQFRRVAADRTPRPGRRERHHDSERYRRLRQAASYKAMDQLIDGVLDGTYDVAVHNGYEMNEWLKLHPDAPLILANLSERRVVVDMDEVEYLYGLGWSPCTRRSCLVTTNDEEPAQPEPEITTIGRALFNRILPDEMRFVQETLSKKSLQKLVAQHLPALRPGS